MSTEDVISNDLKCRQGCAALIQDLGHLHNVSQLLVNTAIVYMHKLYEKFSFKELKPVYVAITSFYLSSKTEDSARKLCDIVKSIYHLSGKPIDSQFDRVVASVHALESIMLMCIGFPRLDFIHPHNVIIDIVKKYDIHRGFAETAYFICTAMLHLTSLVVRYSTQEIALSSLYVASKWDYIDLREIETFNWFHSISSNISFTAIQKISREFIYIYLRTPVKLKLKTAQFLKRFNSNNKKEHNVHSTTTSASNMSSKIMPESYSNDSEKLEPLEDGEIERSSDYKLKNDYSQNRKFSLNPYFRRKDGSEIKSSPLMKSQLNSTSSISVDKKRKQNDQSISSVNPHKLRKLDCQQDSDNSKGSFYQSRKDRSATPDEYYNSF